MDKPTRLTLEEALLIIAFGQGLTPEEYNARVNKHPARLAIAFQELRDAAYQSHVELEGVDSKGAQRPIPWLDFGPGVGQPDFEFPPSLDLDNEITEPSLAIVWEKAGGCHSLVWERVHVDRASLERWLEAGSTETAPSVREKKKPGAKPDYDWDAIENAARLIAAKPKVPGIKPATERLIAAIQKWHQTQRPNERFPSRSAIQRKLDKWELP